jgi:hypothetical protein
MLIPYIISNIVALVLLFVAYKNTSIARLLFLLLFAWACWLNFSTAYQQPEIYLIYAKGSLPIYSDFINGSFKSHIKEYVSVIAFGQGLIALGMLLNRLWVILACVGSILFLLAIAPLGLNAAFPFSLIVSAAAIMILRNDKKDYLWNFRKKHKSKPASEKKG